MRVGKWYGPVSRPFPHESDLLPADARNVEKKVAFFDGLCWYAALSPFTRCIFVSRAVGRRGRAIITVPFFYGSGSVT